MSTSSLDRVTDGFDPSAFDPLDPDYLADPPSVLSRARADCPVFFMEKYGMWAVTRYEDMVAVLSDTDTYSSAMMTRVPEVPAKYRAQMEYFPVELALPSIDPPVHTHIKRLAQKAFTPAAARAHEGQARDIANSRVDLFINDGTVDLVPNYTEQIPLRMVAAMFGVDPDEGVGLRRWSMDAVALMIGTSWEEDALDDVSSRIADFDAFMKRLIKERRENPGTDVLSMLVHARDDEGGAVLTEKELLGIASVILTGGTDTTSGLLARLVYELLRRPDQLEELRSNHKLIGNAVDEALRFFGPSGALIRVSTRESVIGGHTIPAGSVIWLSQTSANRDDSTFAEPEEFNIHRARTETVKHLGTGKGTHFCIGSHFARMEAKIGLEVLLDRLPNLRLSNPDDVPKLSTSIVLTGIEHLQVSW